MTAGLIALALTGCGGGKKKSEPERPLNKAAVGACKGSQLSAAPKLPAGFPHVAHVNYTEQSTEGPTNVVEGYFGGSIKDAHDSYKKALQGAGYKILFDELEEHDSEVSWSGEGRSGQVALREDCPQSDRIYVHITNRPA